GREKRLVRRLRQEAHAKTERVAGIRRTLASLPNRRKLVHVACLRTRRLQGHQQDSSPTGKKKEKSQGAREAKKGPSVNSIHFSDYGVYQLSGLVLSWRHRVAIHATSTKSDPASGKR